MYRIVISERIKEYRIKKQLSQRDLAMRLHVTPQAISKWEKAVAYPNIDLLPHLADCLGCSVENFFEKKS